MTWKDKALKRAKQLEEERVKEAAAKGIRNGTGTAKMRNPVSLDVVQHFVNVGLPPSTPAATHPHLTIPYQNTLAYIQLRSVRGRAKRAIRKDVIIRLLNSGHAIFSYSPKWGYRRFKLEPRRGSFVLRTEHVTFEQILREAKVGVKLTEA